MPQYVLKVKLSVLSPTLLITDRLKLEAAFSDLDEDRENVIERVVPSWAATRPEFRRQYDLARELGRHTIGENVLAIADCLTGSAISTFAHKEDHREAVAK